MLPLLIAAILSMNPAYAAFSVTATVETKPVPSSGDAADDSAVWVHPTDPSQSVVIGTNKKGGLAVYNLNGTQVQYRADGLMNNVDLRYNFPLGGKVVDIFAASNRSNNSISLYQVNPSTHTIEPIHARTITVSMGDVYGIAMYRSRISGKYYVFVTDKDTGRVEQWELFEASGKIDAKRVRSISVGSQTEGVVADDELGNLFVGEEDVGIWKYGAEPGDGSVRVSVDKVGSRLTADVEGLAIYYGKDGSGYLLASNQGANRYNVYDRRNVNAFIDSFAIVNGTVDGTNDTDGIEVMSFGLGSLFPEGVFIAQDGSNDNGYQNYKLVPWGRIARGASVPLQINTSVDPRMVLGGGRGSSTPTASPSPTVSASSAPSPESSPNLEPDLPSSSRTALNKQIPSQSGAFTAEMILQPSANNIDASTILAGQKVVNYVDGAMIVRLNPSGMIDVRNGGGYAALAAVPYAASRMYHVKIAGNVLTRKYSVTVTPPGGAPIQIAKDFSFRTEQASVTLINHLASKSSAGSHAVYGFKIAPVNTASPSPIVSISPAPSPMVTSSSTPISVKKFVVAEDSSVKAAYPTANYGKGSRLNTDGSPLIEALMKFNVSGVSGVVQNAKVRIYLSNGSSNGPAIYGSGTNWSEFSVNWNNRPGRTTGILADKGSVSTYSWQEYDVTSVVKGNGTYSFTLVSSSSDGVGIHSRQGTYVPELVVTTGSGTTSSPSPSPSKSASPSPSPSPSKSASPSPSPSPSKSASPSPSPSPTASSAPTGWTPAPCGSSNNHVAYMGVTWWNNSACKPYSIGLSGSKKVMRYEVRYNEGRWNGADDESPVERSELAHPARIKPGTEIWASYAMMVEPGANTDSRWTILGQMHGGSGGLSPPLNFDLSPTNQLRIMTLHSGANGMQQRAVVPITRGKWYNIVYRVKFQGSGYSGSGILEVWVNGSKVYSNTSMQIGHSSAPDNYWKFGIYRRTSSVILGVQYANMEFTTGAGALSGRIASPLPIQY